MKKILGFLFLLSALPVLSFTLGPVNNDYIFDDYIETNAYSFHSKGLFTYGAHLNTFHLRHFYIRNNWNLPNVQFFATVRGYKDTHQPESNYTFPLRNIDLYDYGVRFQFFNMLLVGFQGAAVYQFETETYMLVPHYYIASNLGEFDTPKQYLPLFLTAAGLRIGYFTPNMEIAYSQGDYRHSIPMAAIFRMHSDWWKLRLTLQIENENPLVYAFDLYRLQAQISTTFHFKSPGLDYFILSEVSYLKSGLLHMRFEQAVRWESLTLSFRELWKQTEPSLIEASLMFDASDFADIGVMAGTDGRIYLGSAINF